MMDALRELATLSFEEHDNFSHVVDESDGIATIKLIRIAGFPMGETKFESLRFHEDDASSPELYASQTWDGAGGDQPDKLLNMVVIPRDDMEGIEMPKAKFLGTFQALQLDPYFLDLIRRNWYGFYAGQSRYRGRQSFFIGTVLYSLAFSLRSDDYGYHGDVLT
jgi:hypothetical protein